MISHICSYTAHRVQARRQEWFAYSVNCMGQELRSYVLNIWNLWQVSMMHLSECLNFFQTPSKKKVEISTVASNYHIEMNPR